MCERKESHSRFHIFSPCSLFGKDQFNNSWPFMEIQQLNIYQECILGRETHQQPSKWHFSDNLE